MVAATHVDMLTGEAAHAGSGSLGRAAECAAPGQGSIVLPAAKCMRSVNSDAFCEKEAEACLKHGVQRLLGAWLCKCLCCLFAGFDARSPSYQSPDYLAFPNAGYAVCMPSSVEFLVGTTDICTCHPHREAVGSLALMSWHCSGHSGVPCCTVSSMGSADVSAAGSTDAALAKAQPYTAVTEPAQMSRCGSCSQTLAISRCGLLTFTQTKLNSCGAYLLP